MPYGFRKMVDLARTPAEIREDIKSTIAPTMASAPVYPYGLCLSLDEDILEKLGLGDEELPEVGDMIHLVAMARVTSCSESERENAKGEKEKCCRIELQITHLAAEDEDDETEETERAERKSVPRERRIKQRYGEHEIEPDEEGEMHLTTADYED